MRRTPRAAARFLGLVPLAALFALAALAWWPVYGSPAFVVAATGAVVLGTAIGVVGAWRRWPSWLLGLSTVGAIAVTGVPLAVPGGAVAGVLPSLDGLRRLATGVVTGWRQLLTITLPVGDYQELLVSAFVLLLLAAVVASSVALRGRYPELGSVPPLVALLAGVAFGPRTAELPVLVGVGALVTCVAWSAAARRGRRRGTRAAARDASGRLRLGVGVRSALAGVLVLAVTGAAGAAAAGVLAPPSDRHVLRDVVVQPFDPRTEPSPLAGFRRYLRADRVDEVMLRVTGLPEGARIRIATLDSYDGVVFAAGSGDVDPASGSFVRFPGRVGAADAGGDTRLRVTVEGYRGVWVPTVGELHDIAFLGDRAAMLDDGFRLNDATGTAAELAGVEHGTSYLLEASGPVTSSLEGLADEVPGGAEVPRRAEPPEALVRALDGYLGDAASPGEQLAAAIRGLRSEGYISHGLGAEEPPSRSGHSLDRIGELFAGTRMVGDAEQYAVAAALMATRLGFPSRVVVGFAPSSAGTDAETLVRGSDISAWIEVDTAQNGWVAIDPVPESRPIPEEEPQEPTPVTRPESIVPPPADRPDPRDAQTDPDTASEQPIDHDTTLETLLGVLRTTALVLLGLLVLLAPFLLILLAKARRRRLRATAPGSLARIRGGWDEFADLVVDHGLPVPAAATRTEFAAVVGTLPSRVLAAVVDRAVFSPEAPSEADAERVWRAVGELRHALDAGRTRRAQWRARLSVRSLGGGSARMLLRRRSVS